MSDRTRISALNRLARALTTNFLAELLEGQADELIPLLQTSLKKGGAEAEWASKVLALVWMTGGPHEAYSQLASFFKRAIKDVDIENRSSLMSSFAVIAFMDDLDDQDIWALLKDFQAVFASENDGLLVANALSAFALLYTKLSTDTKHHDLSECFFYF
jgi:hypothetical protein